MSQAYSRVELPIVVPDASVVRAAFRAGSSAAWPLWLVCKPDAFQAFAATWWYFRWADDIVDAPDRVAFDVRWFVLDQRLLLDARRAPVGPEEAALVGALAHRRHGHTLTRAADLMLRALEWDARRGPEARPAAEIEAQIARIGDAFALALWTCTGERGAPSEAACELARAATAAHQVRDLREDIGLGYCNAPAEALSSYRLTRGLPPSLPVSERTPTERAASSEARSNPESLGASAAVSLSNGRLTRGLPPSLPVSERTPTERAASSEGRSNPESSGAGAAVSLANGPIAADLAAWALRRADEIDGRFERALAALSGVRWRTRLVFTLLAWRYRRGLRRWARQPMENP